MSRHWEKPWLFKRYLPILYKCIKLLCSYNPDSDPTSLILPQEPPMSLSLHSLICDNTKHQTLITCFIQERDLLKWRSSIVFLMCNCLLYEGESCSRMLTVDKSEQVFVSTFWLSRWAEGKLHPSHGRKLRVQDWWNLLAGCCRGEKERNQRSQGWMIYTHGR